MTQNIPKLEPKPDAAIQQINLSYNAEQDRLLFRVGLNDNSELLVWLTSRITKMIWRLLSGETSIPTATSIQAETLPQQAVAQFQQEMQTVETLQKMDFATEYQPRPEVRNDGAMLAINALLIQAENKQSTLELPCLEGVTVRMNLNPVLILAICNMLKLTTKEAGWDLGASAQTQVQVTLAADAGEKKILH